MIDLGLKNDEYWKSDLLLTYAGVIGQTGVVICNTRYDKT